MATMRWIERTAEYVVGAAIVLAFLARAGRGLRVEAALRGRGD